MFYKTPPELKGVEDAIQAAGQQIALTSTGNHTPGFMQELMAKAAQEMQQTRDRMVSQGRHAELKKFMKHVLYVGGYMDNGAFNHTFRPFVLEHLAP
jgi:hypothetical protein